MHVKKLLLAVGVAVAALLVTGTAVAATPVPVVPGNMQGWAFFDDNGNGGTGALVNGPATPPLGAGSAELAVPNSNQGYALGNAAYAGTRLDAITNLGYSSYQPGPTLAIALQFDVKYRPADASYDGRLVFEPYQNGHVSVGSGWQHWSPLSGIWWASHQGATNGTNGLCPISSPCSWSTILADFPDATISGSVVFKAGSGWSGFDGNVDAFTIGVNGSDTTYDFEPATPCTTICYVNATTGNDTYGGDTPATAKQTIEAAVNQVSPGGTVVVAAGGYTENVVISNPMTVDGAGAGNNPVTGGRTFGSPAESTLNGQITIQAPNVTVDGFSETKSVGSGAAFGIVVKTAGSGAVIENDIIDTVWTPDTGGNGTAQGIYLEHGPDNVQILGNVISNVHSNRSAKGILIGDSAATDPSDGVLIQGNSISAVTSDAKGAYGVQVNNHQGASSLTVDGNTFDSLSGGGWVHAVGLEADTPNVVVTKNTFSNLTASGVDRVAVWFESEDASFATGHVNRNNLDVGSSTLGIAVDPALGAGPVDGTCNWWGSAYGPAPSGPGSPVSPGAETTPWLTTSDLNGSCIGGTARGYKTQALGDLAGLVPSGSKDTDKRVNDAIAAITSSLDRPNWNGDNRLDGKHADKIFDDEKHAVKSLMEIKGGAPAAAMQAIEDLLTADRILAQTAIDDMTAAGGDAKKLADAAKEMAKAQEEIGRGHFDAAVDHYKNAWKKAAQA
jgi:hypothetical protein